MASLAFRIALSVAVHVELYREMADRRYRNREGIADEMTEAGGQVPPLSLIGVTGIHRAEDEDWAAIRLLQRLNATPDALDGEAGGRIVAVAEEHPLRAEALLHALDADPRPYLDALGLVGAAWVTEALARWEYVEDMRGALEEVWATATVDDLWRVHDWETYAIARRVEERARWLGADRTPGRVRERRP